MSRGPDAGALLERALLASATRAGCAITIVEAGWERWASATFAGARHTMSLEAATNDGLERWIADLPEADLAMRRGLVADLTVARICRAGARVHFTIEALTIEA